MQGRKAGCYRRGIVEYQAPNEYKHQQYITFEWKYSTYFNMFQLFLIDFNYIDPMDQLQQVLHLF